MRILIIQMQLNPNFKLLQSLYQSFLNLQEVCRKRCAVGVNARVEAVVCVVGEEKKEGRRVTGRRCYFTGAVRVADNLIKKSHQKKECISMKIPIQDIHFNERNYKAHPSDREREVGLKTYPS